MSWDLCPLGPHAPLHVPIWVSPGLSSKMDLLLPWPCPLESEASLRNEAWPKLQGGRTRWRETQFLSGMATRCPRAARNHPLSLGLSFHTCKLLPLDCSPALFPIAGAGRFRLQLRAWESLILSRRALQNRPLVPTLSGPCLLSPKQSGLTGPFASGLVPTIRALLRRRSIC